MEGSRQHTSLGNDEEDTDSRKCLILDEEGQRKIKATSQLSVLDGQVVGFHV